ncbi:hypothetical protein A4X09_0g6542 [Tilletia walkeri]|uniref:Reverse transcriptase Ty1/copia-type domain-containing protein n=1 Tax=Tilletia walkeri TaxID=117179 RepID=A0A8X7N435_9BASI|nr:hypothetical protein A4X09_0g6542 [Tilletia walkeri]
MFVREGDSPAILPVYVDAILVAAPRGGGIEGVKQELLGITRMGRRDDHLGTRAVRQRGACRFGMSDCNPARTSWDQKASLRKAIEGDARADKRIHQTIVGCLAYLAQGTRLDLAYVVTTLGRFCSDPSETRMVPVKRVLRYLNKTSGAKLTFGGQREVSVEGVVDSDWAADRTDRRSTLGFVFTVGGGAVSWGLRKQGAVALSTAEAEYVAA